MECEVARKYFILFIGLLYFVVGCAAHKGVEESEPRVVLGNSRFDQYVDFLQGKRVALVVNQSSLVGDVHLCDTLLALGVDVKKIFAPEHGFRGTADAGEHIKDGKDSKTGIEIVSLYGKNKKPSEIQMQGIDVVLYDLQDVGVRFYTYISTMHYVMEACAELGISMLVLDRPNPNGDYIDGPVLEKDCKSFVGMHPIPIVYGMTCGELAYMINGEGWLANGVRCDLKVVQMLYYQRENRYELTVAPSPNLKSYDAIRRYPSLCFFEATNVSVGRGTDKPFVIYGSPYIHSGEFKFTPQPVEGAKNPPFKGKECRGYDLSTELDEQRINLSYLLDAYKEIGDTLFWTDKRFFDLLAGTKTLREQLQMGLSEEQIKASWQENLDAFKQKRSKYLLYETQKAQQVAPIDWDTAVTSEWIDSTLMRMTLEEKIAQLVWVTIGHTSNERDINNVRQNIEQYGVGGVLLLQGKTTSAMGITAMLQGCSKLPLLFSADAENGLSMKFSQVVDFPKNITLGSLPEVSLIEQMGRSVGRQMKECGIQVNFAPVVDVNTNPSNPIIGVRSFGENPHRVSQAALAYVRGLQSEGCVAVVKHFPGHGDTSQDSHTSLPFVSTTRERMDSVELLPFRTCIENGVMGVMSAHLNVPALDKTVKSTSVSRQVLEVLLREEMGFKGLVVSDAVNMDGLKIATAGTNVEAACLEGGTDVVEFSLDVESAINSVKEKIEKGVLTESEIDMKVRRVLAVKEWCAKYARQESGMRGQVNSLDAECLSDMIFKKSVTILQNNNLESRDVRIKTFGEWPEFAISQNDKENQIIWLLVDEKSISQYNEYIERLPSQSKIVVMYLGNPYKIKRMKIRDTDGFVVMYESTPRAKRVAQMYVIKRFEACGIMPVTVGKYKEGIN